MSKKLVDREDIPLSLFSLFLDFKRFKLIDAYLNIRQLAEQYCDHYYKTTTTQTYDSTD